jgi:hypothetical protein
MDHGYGMGMVATKARREERLFSAVVGASQAGQSSFLHRSKSLTVGSSAGQNKSTKSHFSYQSRSEYSQSGTGPSHSMSGWDNSQTQYQHQPQQPSANSMSKPMGVPTSGNVMTSLTASLFNVLGKRPSTSSGK